MNICDECINKMICRFTHIVKQTEEYLYQQMTYYESLDPNFYLKDIFNIQCSKMQSYKADVGTIVETIWGVNTKENEK